MRSEKIVSPMIMWSLSLGWLIAVTPEALQRVCPYDVANLAISTSCVL